MTQDNKVKVYNKGTLVAIQSDDGLWIEAIDNTPNDLWLYELFGPKSFNVNKVSLWDMFVPYFLEERSLPNNRLDLQVVLERNEKGSRHELARDWNYRMGDDDIEVVFPKCCTI